MADHIEGDIKMTDVVSEQNIMEAEKKRWTPGYVIGHIMKFEKFADEVEATDEELWQGFQDYFEGWAVNNFKLAGLTDLNNLRTYLRQHGVYVQKRQGYSVAKALHKILVEEEPAKWPADELADQMGRKSFYSKRTSQPAQTTMPLQYPLTATPPPVEPRYQNFPENPLFESARNTQGFHQTSRGQQQAQSQQQSPELPN
ncbi:hypothetical protein K3495_g12354, partial [Podosphaera aphanis]